MKKTALLLISLSVLLNCCKPKMGTKVQADPEYFGNINEGPGLEFLTLLTDNKVQDYEKKYAIKIPEQFLDKKIAWGGAYFTGLKKSKTGYTIFFLILNYDTTDTQIVFDKNGNADFTDDSIISIEAGKWFKIFFYNQKNPKAIFISNFKFRNNVTDTTYIKLHKAMTAKRKGSLPSQFMVFDKRQNFRKIILPDSNIITLNDFNCNGFYNDKEDKIIAGDIQKDGWLINYPVKYKYVKSGIELPFWNNTYKVVKVYKYGNSADLIKLDKIIDTTERLVNFTYTDGTRGKKKFIIQATKPYSVLYIWGAWCIGCHYQAPGFIKLMNEYKFRIDYYTFNYGDKEEVMKKYMNTKKYPFQPYRIDQKNVNKLHVESFPSYIVIDNQQKIVLRTSDIEELDKFFHKK